MAVTGYMKRVLPAALFSLLLGYLGLVFLANQGIYATRFDPAYWKDKYENSQWHLPQSARGIGDDGLYLAQGYLLTQGADPTTMNAEVPPIGKYAIGAAIQWLGNGNLYGFIMTMLAVVSMFLLSRTILPLAFALAATLLFATDPLLTQQFRLTMLESQQTAFFLLTFVWLLAAVRATGARQILATLLAGLCFGIFAATKAPLFVPLVGVVSALFLFTRTNKLSLIIAYVASAITVYVAQYIYYFMLGHTPLQWLGVQKWIFNFYAHANLTPTWGSMLATMVTGWSQNIFTRAWERVAEWSPAWSVLFIGAMLEVLSLWRQKIVSQPLRSFTTMLIILLLVLVAGNNMMPFWTRYLLLPLPLVYLFGTSFLTRLRPTVAALGIAGLLAVNTATSITVLFPTPEATVKQFLYDWQHGFFQDMYESLTTDAKALRDRASFHRFGQSVFADGEIEAVTITMREPAWSRWKTRQEVPLTVTYQTRNLGPFTQTATLPTVKERGLWRIPWQWDFLFDELDRGAKLETTVYPAKRGTIVVKTQAAPAARDLDSWLVWVTPQQVDREREDMMLKLLESLMIKRAAASLLHLRYVQKLPDRPVPVGIIRTPLEGPLLARLSSYPGVTLSPAYFRWVDGRFERLVGQIANTKFSECCSFFYTTTTYDGVSGWEHQYNDILKGINGGSLVLKDSQGNIIKTFIQNEKQDGKTVEVE